MPAEFEKKIRALCAVGRELSRELCKLEESGEPQAEQAERLGRARALVEQAMAGLEGGAEAPSAPRAGGLRARLAQVFARRPAAAAPKLPTPAVAGPDPGGIRGTSAAVSIPDLLGFLQVQGKTGRLEIELPGERISLQVLRGNLVAARSDNAPPGCRLGEILVESGAIERGTLDAFVVYHSRGAGRIGRALELNELVSREQLHDALVEQAQRIVQRLMRAGSATFAFQEGEEVRGDEDFNLNVIELLLESARQYDEQVRASDAVPPALPAEPAPLPEERTTTL